jgi:hypothetical protein
MFRRGTCNSQGGAIVASGADVKIYTNIFESNSAGGDVSSTGNCSENFLKFSLQFPVGDMEPPLTGWCSFNSTRTTTKLDAERRGKCQLSFALLFSSIGALSAQKKLSETLLQFPAGHIHGTTFHRLLHA